MSIYYDAPHSLLTYMPENTVVFIDEMSRVKEMAESLHKEITLAANALIEHGAKEVYACCTHPVLSGPAIERIKNSKIKELVVTNSIVLPEERQIDKIKMLSVGPLMAEAIIRVHEHASVSTLFFIAQDKSL